MLASSAVGALTFLDPNTVPDESIYRLLDVHIAEAAETLELNLKIQDGASVFILWGDGGSTQLTDGVDGGPTPGDITRRYTHAYSAPGVYPLWIIGDLHEIEAVYVDDPGVGLQWYLEGFWRFSGLLAGLFLLAGSVKGDLATLASFGVSTQAVFLGARQTETDFLVGDLDDIVHLENVEGISLLTMNSFFGNKLTYTGAALPAWSLATIGLWNCSLSAADVDRFLINLDAAGGSLGTLYISSGTGFGPFANEARTSASDAAVASLVARSWTIS